MRRRAVLLFVLWGVATTAGAEAEEAPDRQWGREVNQICAACHGEFGQGGKGGIYPRLAGLTAEYLSEQLRKFFRRERLNIPMIPYANERELPDDDLKAVVDYLSSIELGTHLPDLDPDNPPDGLERLLQTKKVVQIPRYDGDVENGEQVYVGDCSLCHGRDGLGKKKAPRLVGQYSAYLMAQMDHFMAGERDHEDAGLLFVERDRQDLHDVLAYLSALDD